MDWKPAEELRTAVSFLLVWGGKKKKACQHDRRFKGKMLMNRKYPYFPVLAVAWRLKFYDEGT